MSIPFDSVTDHSEWVDIETESVGPPVSSGYSDFFKRETWDPEPLTEALSRLLVADKAGDFVLFQIHCRIEESSVESLAVGYLSNRRVVLARLDPSENFDAWMRALAGSFGTDRPLLFTIRRNGHSGSPHFGADPLLATAQFVKKHAPSDYSRDNRDAAKDRFLRERGALATQPSEPAAIGNEPLPIVSESWREIVDLAGATEIPGAAAEVFEQFSEVAGFALPGDLQSILEVTDGVPDGFAGLRLLSGAEIMSEWSVWKTVWDEWSIEELQGNSSAHEDLTLGLYCCPMWVPFARTDDGAIYAIDLLPGEGGSVGQVISFGRDRDQIMQESPSLQWFLFSELDFRRALSQAQQS